MFNRVKTTPNSPRKSIQIVEFFREGKKVQQHIVRHVGIAMDADEEGAFRQLAEHIRAGCCTSAVRDCFRPYELARDSTEMKSGRA